MGYKIGPLFADDADVAESLYLALTASVPGEKFYLDVIEPNKAAVGLARNHGLRRSLPPCACTPAASPPWTRPRSSA